MRVPSFYFCLRMAFYMKVSIFRSKADSKRDSTGKRFFFFFFFLFVCFFEIGLDLRKFRKNCLISRFLSKKNP